MTMLTPAAPIYFQADIKPNNMSLKWIIKFVLDVQLVKSFNLEDVHFQKTYKYFSLFEAGYCVSISSFK